jgi:hypothetical protein
MRPSGAAAISIHAPIPLAVRLAWALLARQGTVIQQLR